MTCRTPVLLVAALAWVSPLVADDGVEFFEKKVRPILVRHCYKCHAAESQELKGGLRLDLRAGWQRGGESGEAAIVPGKPDASPLIRAVRHDGDVSAMPPGDARLSAEQVRDLVDWVRLGAPDPRDGVVADQDTAWTAEFQRRLDWWSLQPVGTIDPPDNSFDGARDAIDQFIGRQLKQAGLQPASHTDALTLLRRLSFVLSGLPPSPEEVDLFPREFADDREAALTRLVDRLLDSPHYGERFARHWMDVVRYTDTYGYEWDNPAKGSWEYRDYLTRAFNNDIGFDQLIREQIAGDLLPTPRIDEESGYTESLIGPMFYHMGEHRHGDNVRINGVREEMIDNKIDAFSKAFLAMTVACARCHDHKLDAVSQQDYYALAGVFMTPRWTARSIESPGKHATKIGELKRLRAAIQSRLGDLWAEQLPTLATGETLRKWAMANREAVTSAKPGDVAWVFQPLLHKTKWLPTRDLAVTAAADTTKLVVDQGGSILAEGAIPQKDTYTITFETAPGLVDVLRLEALTHDSLGQRGPGRTPHGNFVLSHLRVSVQPLDDSGQIVGEPSPVTLSAARADYSQPSYPIGNALDSAGNTGWGVGLGGNVDRTAWFTFAEPVKLPRGGRWTVTLEHQYGSQHILGRFRVTPGVESVRSPEDAQPIAAAWEAMRDQWRSLRDARRAANAKFTTLTDFSEPGLPDGWVTDGAGIDHGYAAGGEPLVSLEGESVVERLLPRGYHTHALSSKLPGAIRLPPQELLPGKTVSVALAGGEWSGYLRLADNAFQTETVTFLLQDQPAWKSFADIGLPNGIQRVAYEIATSDLNPDFPPRTGVARAGSTRLPDNDDGGNKRSWFSITGIVSHDAAGQPADEMTRFNRLFDETPESSEQAWPRIGQWLAASVETCCRLPESDDPATNDDVTLVNWLLTNKLLPNTVTDDPQLAELIGNYRDVEESLSFARSANSMDERGVAPIDYRLNVRGDIHIRGDRVPHRFLDVFANEEVGSPAVTRLWPRGDATGRTSRRQLADFLADSRHGLAARVYVNRVWQWLFGTGLVRTPNDFGRLGELPSHPELLNYVTRQFIADGWSTKRLVRRLVLTQTFRQTGEVSTHAATVDPDNRLWHHYPTRRLEAEAVRDALLAASGRLDATLYGRPINPRRHVEDAKKRLFSGPLDGNGRRSIYLEVSIMDRSKFLQSFNAPDPKLPTGRRDVTSGPSQALVMLNDPFVVAMAEHWANQLVSDDHTSIDGRLRGMFVRALGRPTSDGELRSWRSLVEGLTMPGADPLTDQLAWQHVAHTMFNLQEFVYYK